MSKMPADQRLPHLLVYPKDLSPYAIVVGDSKRVKRAASLMSDVREVGNNREYLTVTGEYNGRRVTVASHGIGAGGANLCFMELIHGGVTTIIRAGTCGALDPEIEDGQIIITTGAVREDRVTDQLMPIQYPALADHVILGALLDAAQANRIHHPHLGLSVTYANFYPSPILPSPYKKYLDYGVKAIEMELAGLFVIALMNGVRAGGILTSDGNMVRGGSKKIDAFEFDPHREVVEQGIMKMLKIALDAVTKIA